MWKGKSTMEMMTVSLMLITLRVGLNVTGYQPPVGNEFLWHSSLSQVRQAPLAIDQSMMDFVDARIDSSGDPGRRLNQLVQVLSDPEGFNFRFDALSTKSARQAFATRSGNCVAYSLMFVSLARYARLDARFQEKVIRRSARRLRGTPIYCRHLNVVVSINGREFEIDPGVIRPIKFGHGRIVPDQLALASYYNNRATECLTSGRQNDALAFIRRSLKETRGFAPAWVSLGVYYRLQNVFAQAEHAYRRAIELNPDSAPAAMNLAHLYFLQGKPQAAERMFDQAGVAKRNNPYRHYLRALAAIDEGRLEDAERSLQSALELHPNQVFSRTLIRLRRMRSSLESTAAGSSKHGASNGVLAQLRAGGYEVQMHTDRDSAGHHPQPEKTGSRRVPAG